MESFHKWIATLVVVFTLAWGGLAYYVKTEIALSTALINNRMIVIEQQQAAQGNLVSELRGLREDITGLKIALAKVEK